MNNLFKFKAWLTVAEAAQRLSTVFSEAVTEADVLRLALDGHLQLSVRLINSAIARNGKIVPIAEAEYVEVPSPNGTGMVQLYGGPTLFSNGIKVSVVKLERAVVKLTGVYDLPMIGNERLQIENEYQKLTGGPTVTLHGLDGAFVKGSDGLMKQLQEQFDNNQVENIGATELGELLDQHQEPNLIFRQNIDSKNKDDNYCPAEYLPQDGVLVVRADALREFEGQQNGAPEKIDKLVTTTERNTLLVIIAALCKKTDIDPQNRTTASLIARLTDDIDASVTDETIRKHLAKIPDALGARIK